VNFIFEISFVVGVGLGVSTSLLLFSIINVICERPQWHEFDVYV
jgi:hypothetical protein